MTNKNTCEMKNKSKEKHQDLSVFLSLILRHKPEVVDVVIDINGWTNVNTLIRNINKNSEYTIDNEILDEIVETDKKGRYSYNSDKTKIRANQGHSLPHVDLNLLERKPLDILYHGTGIKSIEGIKSNGINKRGRNHVHLSADLGVATEVGKRHGSPFVFKVDAKRMYKDGYKFYLSDNGVWLTDFVPKEYLI